MEQVIYGDVYFVINFSMDFMALFLTGKIFHYHLRNFRLVFAASLGSLYALISLFFPGGQGLYAVLHILLALLICRVAYRWESVGSFLKTTGAFYIISFLIGGGITALFNLINTFRFELYSTNTENPMVSIGNDIPASLVLILGVGICFFALIYGRLANRENAVSFVDVTVLFQGKTVMFRALVDSGNLLCEPLSGLPVIVSDFTLFSDIFNHTVADIIKGNRIEKLEELSPETMKVLRVIPVSSVGYNGVMIGFLPDKIIFRQGKYMKERKACITLEEQPGSYGGYQGIVPQILLK